MALKKCETCIFYTPHKENEHLPHKTTQAEGQCRSRPPAPIVIKWTANEEKRGRYAGHDTFFASAFRTVYPQVRGNYHGCGEHAPKEPEPEVKYYVWPNGDVELAEEWDSVEDTHRDRSDDFQTVFAVTESDAWEKSKK